MKKVTVINAYGDKNIGDAAILKVAISFIKKAYKNDCRISVLCENENAIKKSLGSEKNITPFQLPYGYAIRSKNQKVNSLTKVTRFISIFAITSGMIILNLLFKTKFTSSGFYAYIFSIKDADIIIGMGGGYFTTQSIKDYFGLLLTLLPVYVAKIYKKKIIFLPMSVGPFATHSQENITYQALKNTSLIARDQITLKVLKSLDKDKKINLSYAPDLALFLDVQKNNKQRKMHGDYITLTAREWFLEKDKQLKYEAALTDFVDEVWKKHQLKTQFIPMAKNTIEDNDVVVAKRISSNLEHKTIFKVIEPKNITHVQQVLKNARIAICTRMHSAILATTVHTPFIAIGYGHKTLGFVQNMGLEKWHIDINSVGFNELSKLFEKLFKKKNSTEFIKIVMQKQIENVVYQQRIIDQIQEIV